MKYNSWVMLQIIDVNKEYRTGDLVQTALNGVSFNLRDCEFVSILGPSGSGKTTLLNVIGGLDRYDSGEMIINGVSTRDYSDRDWDSYRNHTVGFVFQSYNLIPHQTVLANVELALTISGISRAERRQRAMDALAAVGLAEQAHKKPNQMSGGQMQRVAIARALVNDPDILLADEPTGALDSETSIQVMDLLREVSRDRLVVMVTHNRELAEEYSTRIINLADGKITGDTNPYIIESGAEEAVHRNMGKSSMSFLTALSLSFNNMKTKRARTLLVSFAGSIGIIGIALILSLSNGVNNYINGIEQDVMKEYPLSIEESGFDISAFLSAGDDDSDTAHAATVSDADADVHEIQTMKGTFGTMTKNDLSSLKKYLDGNGGNIHDYTRAIEYTYSLTPYMYRKTGDTYRQVNPDTAMSKMGFSFTGSGLGTSYMNSDNFHMLPEDESLYKNQYDVKAGRWPENAHEGVLVLSSSGGITDMTLYTLGLKDDDELDDILESYSEGKDVKIDEDASSYDYEDFLDINFKFSGAFSRYSYDEAHGLWVDKSEDESYMASVLDDAQDFRIVGVVQPKEDTSYTVLTAGIGYSLSLIEELAEAADTSDIVQQQLLNKSINVFTGKEFGAEDDDNPFADLFQIDQNALTNAFKIDTSALSSISSSDIDLSDAFDADDLKDLAPDFSENDLKNLISSINFNMTDEDMNNLYNSLVQDYLKNNSSSGATTADIQQQFEEYLASDSVKEKMQNGLAEIMTSEGSEDEKSAQMQNLFSEIMSGFASELSEAATPDPEDYAASFAEYLASDSASKIIASAVSGSVDTDKLQETLSQQIQSYTVSAASAMTEKIMQAVQNNLSKTMASQAKAMQNMISFDTEAFANAISINFTEEEIEELVTSLATSGTATYDGNLETLGYADMARPVRIDIYANDFESKDTVKQILDDYNDDMEANGDDDKVIVYSDIVAALMSSVTDIINAISYVLIAFVSISLVVSSIMIGVITYISVLERRKEIGILRAIGASKRNISEVFNAETFIIGGLAGVIAIIMTELLLIPANSIIQAVTNGVNMRAALPAGAAVILICLSIVLTLIGGLIPSKKAAKSDPVEALRTE